MFDIGATELLMVVVVAVLVIGPKDMPMALRTAGRWIGKMRRISGHFRSGLDTMIREAEMEEMEKKWRDQNAKIMRHNPSDTVEMEPTGAYPAKSDDSSTSGDTPPADAAATDHTSPALPASAEAATASEPVVKEDR